MPVTSRKSGAQCSQVRQPSVPTASHCGQCSTSAASQWTSWKSSSHHFCAFFVLFSETPCLHSHSWPWLSPCGCLVYSLSLRAGGWRTTVSRYAWSENAPCAKGCLGVRYFFSRETLMRWCQVTCLRRCGDRALFVSPWPLH